MAFLSEILGHTITDIDGRYIGKLEDLIAREPADAVHPIVDAVVIKDRNKTTIIPYILVMALFAPSIPLKCRADEITVYDPSENDIFLSRDVLDKQIIDTDGARVVRVNDLELVRVNGTLYVGNVDIGIMGIFRRLGIASVTQRLTTSLKLPASQTFISWDDVELLRGGAGMPGMRSAGRATVAANPLEFLSSIAHTAGAESMQNQANQGLDAYGAARRKALNTYQQRRNARTATPGIVPPTDGSPYGDDPYKVGGW